MKKPINVVTGHFRPRPERRIWRSDFSVALVSVFMAIYQHTFSGEFLTMRPIAQAKAIQLRLGDRQARGAVSLNRIQSRREMEIRMICMENPLKNRFPA